MTLIILTARPEIATNRRLAEAAQTAGFDAVIVDASRTTAEIRDGRAVLRVERSDLLDPRPAGILARIGNWRPETLLATLEVAVAGGVFTPNSPEAIRLGRDHWRTILCLGAAGIAAPGTMAGMDPEATAVAAAERFGFPVVVKVRRSRMGVGVILCRQLDHLESVLDSLWRVGDEFIVQQFIPPGGTSVRAVVVGGRVVAAARFDAGSDEWRSNGARGATAHGITLDTVETEMAIAAAQATALGVCGVDLLSGPQGPVVCEVNPTAGFVRLEKATGIDVAGAVVRFAVKRADQPG
ncbi:MAG: RimK family alpha-L-glutamate ligase [Thermoanaerobaculales bacterium]|nr:RimK family alpha-L-glutamate ligase [Thermoanaerobaculales bacterium]